MRSLAAVVSLALAGCSSAAPAEEFAWSVECPPSVERGAEFFFTVKASNAGGEAVDGIAYRYQVLWPDGSSRSLRLQGVSGERRKVRALVVAGAATLVFSCPNRLETKMLETRVEVK